MAEGRCSALKPRWTGRWVDACLAVLWAAVIIGPGKGMGQDSASFRLAFSSSMFTDFNENDAKAAVKAWSQTVARERGIEVDPETRVFKDIPSLTLALQNGQVDAAGITTAEYEIVSARIKLAPIFLARVNGRIDEEYVGPQEPEGLG